MTIHDAKVGVQLKISPARGKCNSAPLRVSNLSARLSARVYNTRAGKSKLATGPRVQRDAICCLPKL